MNFLAHIFLSGELSEITVGNFIADSVKGNALQNYSAGIQKGIKLHRAIDSYTDMHPVVQQSKERLRLRFNKYAPVVADVFYDHFLAMHWNNYSGLDLREYTGQVYSFLEKYSAFFPERSKMFFDYMLRYDILYAYAKTEGIDKVMQGMARRASFPSGMEQAKDELVSNYEKYKEEFLLFFPDLQKHCINTMTQIDVTGK